MKKVKAKIVYVCSLLMIMEGIMAQQLTLKQCVETAIANNLQVRQSEYQSQSDKVSFQQAKANQLPFISGNVYHGINQGRSIDPFTNTYPTQQVNFANYNINTGITIWNGSAVKRIRVALSKNLSTILSFVFDLSHSSTVVCRRGSHESAENR